MTDEEQSISISRQDLYELVWSKPMSDLAKDFGVSDVGLAKRCKRLKIPVPGRGYWARLDAGQKPYQPKLPVREDEPGDYRSLSMGPTVGAYSAEIVSSIEAKEALEDISPESVAACISSLAIPPALPLTAALAPVKRTASKSKHPNRSDLRFARGEKEGPLVDLKVTEAALDRTLRLADCLLRAAESLGWIFGTPEALRARQGLKPMMTEPTGRDSDAERDTHSAAGHLLVEGEQVAFRIEERMQDKEIVPTAAQLAREKKEYWYQAPRKQSVGTGALRVVRLDAYRSWGQQRRSWYDRGGKKVEQQIPQILLGFYELSLSTKERRLKDEQQAREREEEARRQQEVEANRTANHKLIEQLERDAGAWYRARYLRRYVNAAKRSLGNHTLPARFRSETVDFLAWAERYLDQLDPLNRSTRTGEFDSNSEYHFQSHGEELKKTLGRLSGADWSKAFKLGNDYTPRPRSGWYYEDKHIFEVGAAKSEDGDR